MLSELYIENVAIIEKTSISLYEGFNLFTGETGAGKSILIDSINLVLGGKPPGSLSVRERLGRWFPPALRI